MVVPQKFINTPSGQPVVVQQMARPSGQNVLFQTTGQNNGGLVQVVQGQGQEFGSNAGSIVLRSNSPATSFQQRVVAQTGSQVGNLSTLPQLAPGSGANLVEDGSNGSLLVQIGNQVYRLEQKTLSAQQQTGIMVQQRNVASPIATAYGHHGAAEERGQSVATAYGHHGATEERGQSVATAHGHHGTTEERGQSVATAHGHHGTTEERGQSVATAYGHHDAAKERG